MDTTTVDVPVDMIARLAGKFKAISEGAEKKVADIRPESMRPMVKNKQPKERLEPSRPKTAGFLDMDVSGNVSRPPSVNEMADRVPDSMYQPKTYKASTNIPTINETMVMNSKLPDSIKQATLKYKDTLQEIKQPLPDVSKTRMDLMGGGQNKQQIAEEYQSQSHDYNPQPQPKSNGSVDEGYIRNLVRDEMLKIMGNEYIKQVKEDTMKKTISTLKKNGLLK